MKSKGTIAVLLIFILLVSCTNPPPKSVPKDTIQPTNTGEVTPAAPTVTAQEAEIESTAEVIPLIPTLSPEITGGVENVPIPDEALVAQAESKYLRASFREGEQVEYEYKLVSDFGNVHYLLAVDKTSGTTILIANSIEGIWIWREADLGDIAGVSGVSFTVLDRQSQHNKTDFVKSLNQFNGIIISTAYWSAYAPKGQIFRPAPDVFNWGYFGTSLQYGTENSMPIDLMKDLVWAKETRLPDWVLSINDPIALENEIRGHIREIADYIQLSDYGKLSTYPIVMDIANTSLERNPILQKGATDVPLLRGISVVNEPGYWGKDIQYYRDHAMEVIGPQYIDIAFEEAYKDFPKGTLLYLTDFDMVLEDGKMSTNTPRFDKNLETIRSIRASGIETAGLSFQLHLDAGIVVTPKMETEIRERLQILRDEGIPFSVSELDIDMSATGLTGQDKIRKQAELYRWWVKIMHEYGCRFFNVYGVNDSNSWLEIDGSKPEADPTLIDDKFKNKFAYYELISYFTELVARQ